MFVLESGNCPFVPWQNGRQMFEAKKRKKALDIQNIELIMWQRTRLGAEAQYIMAACMAGSVVI